jgi:hypothetical protein
VNLNLSGLTTYTTLRDMNLTSDMQAARTMGAHSTEAQTADDVRQRKGRTIRVTK